MDIELIAPPEPHPPAPAVAPAPLVESVVEKNESSASAKTEPALGWFETQQNGCEAPNNASYDAPIVGGERPLNGYDAPPNGNDAPQKRKRACTECHQSKVSKNAFVGL